MVNATKAVLAADARAGRRHASSTSAPLPRRCRSRSRHGIPSPRPQSAPIPSRLFNEVKQMGVSVCAIMPGDIHTGFTAAREKSAVGDDVYAGRIARSVAKMEKDERKRHGSRGRRSLYRESCAEKARKAAVRRSVWNTNSSCCCPESCRFAQLAGCWAFCIPENKSRRGSNANRAFLNGRKICVCLLNA